MTTTAQPTAKTPSVGAASAPASGLPARLAALDRLVELGAGRIDQPLLDDTAALLGRAGQRLRLSDEHTVVALAGGTGSGKSSLFNAVCGLQLSPVGMRRPMTGSAHACVWGLDGAGPLLDWLDVDKRYRYARASALDHDESSVRGLVMIDLPDHDSVRAANMEQVDRYVSVADLLVWVLDPQKYADFAVHHRYLEPLAGHAGVTLVVLNQIDRLEPEEIDDCVGDLRRLLEAEGLHAPNILTASAVTGAGVDGFREVLTDAVAARRARTERLGADVDRLVERYRRYYGVADPPVKVDDGRAATLVDALAAAAGVPAVAEAMESAYELRARDYVGWPPARLGARLRRDPLRHMRLAELRSELRGAFTGPVGAGQPDVDNALAGVTDGVTADLPEAWRRPVREAGRAHAEELPEILGTSLKEAAPAFNQRPGWWWAVRAWQYLLVGMAAVCLVWAATIVAFGMVGVGDPPDRLLGDTGVIPYVALIFLCSLGLGALTASACRNMIALTSARHSERMKRHMHTEVETSARRFVLDPIENELGVYCRFRDEVDGATVG